MLKNVYYMMYISNFFFRPKFLIIPEKKYYSEARAFCKMIGNDFILPRSAAENQDIYSFVSQYHSVCKPQNHVSSFMFLGATDSETNGKWKDFSVGLFL